MPREQVEAELLALYAQAGLRGRPEIHWTPQLERTHDRNERRYAQVLPIPGRPRFELAPQTVFLPERNRRALFAHEIGHVLDPDGGELDADAAGKEATGVKIGYDHRWVGRGERAHWGLQVARNPGSDDAGTRERERAAEAGGDPHARARVIADRLRHGLVPLKWVHRAAHLGDHAAQLVSGIPHIGPQIGPCFIADDPVDMRLQARFAADVAERFIPAMAKGDQALGRQLIEAVRSWAGCPCAEHWQAVDQLREDLDSRPEPRQQSFAVRHMVLLAAMIVRDYRSQSRAQARNDCQSVLATAEMLSIAAEQKKATATVAGQLMAAGSGRVGEIQRQRRIMIALLTGDALNDQVTSPILGDAQCAKCGARYYSGEEGADPRRPVCPACYRPRKRKK